MVKEEGYTEIELDKDVYDMLIKYQKEYEFKTPGEALAYLVKWYAEWRMNPR